MSCSGVGEIWLGKERREVPSTRDLTWNFGLRPLHGRHELVSAEHLGSADEGRAMPCFVSVMCE